MKCCNIIVIFLQAIQNWHLAQCQMVLPSSSIKDFSKGFHNLKDFSTYPILINDEIKMKSIDV